MKQVKICYTDRANIGDAINPFIIREVIGYEPVLADAFHCEITGIGSGLRRFFINPVGLKVNAYYRLKKPLYRQPVTLWSAGFLATPTDKEFCTRNSYNVASVRGELSRQHLEKILNREVDCTTGDGGLLCSRWIPKEQTRYRLGIIPHVKEKGEEIFQTVHKKNPDSIIIDVEDEPIKVLKEISSCECIISSSLHGLIIADSYCVPNKHVEVTNKLSGDGFKFHDYYSSFGLTDDPLKLLEMPDIDTDMIKGEYRIEEKMVSVKQDEIIKAFSKYL